MIERGLAHETSSYMCIDMHMMSLISVLAYRTLDTVPAVMYTT